MEMSPELAYRKGWDASKRTKTYDLDAAESRFIAKHGRAHVRDFIAGWSDHASDAPYRTAGPELTHAVTYLGHVVDVFDTREEAEEGRRELVADIRAGRLPNFLDADDISGVSSFDIMAGDYQ